MGAYHQIISKIFNQKYIDIMEEREAVWWILDDQHHNEMCREEHQMLV